MDFNIENDNPTRFNVYVDDNCTSAEVTENILRILFLSEPLFPTYQGDILHLCQGNGKSMMSYCGYYATTKYLPTVDQYL